MTSFREALKILPGWKELSDRDAISKEYQFSDFKQAWKFMSLVAKFADEVCMIDVGSVESNSDTVQTDHHPEWFNVYNTVRVTLSTHDSGGFTEKDVTLAKHMEQSYVSAAK